MQNLHLWLTWPLIGITALVALWSLAAHWFDQLDTAALWRVTIAAHALIGVQAFVGVAAMSGFDGARPDTHIFYGFLAMLGVGLLFSYRQYPAMAQYRLLLYGGGGLFVSGLLIRTALLHVA